MTQKIADKTVPYNAEAEAAVLGALLIDPEYAWPKVGTYLKPKDFYQERNQELYGVISDLKSERSAVDYVTVLDRLTSQDPSNGIDVGLYVSQLIGSTPTALNVMDYAKIVHNDSMRRRQIYIAQELAVAAFNSEDVDPAALARTFADELLELCRADSKTRLHDVVDVLNEIADEQEAVANGTLKIKGFDPVLPPLRDAVKHGLWWPKAIILIGSNPGIGKSMTMLYQAVYNVLMRGQRGIYVGTEMPAKMIGERIAPMMAYHLEMDGLTRQVLEDYTGATLVRQLAALIAKKCGRKQLQIIDDTATVEEFQALVLSEEAAGAPLDFVVLDYLQMLGSDRVFHAQRELMDYVGEVVRRTSIGADTVLIAASSFTKGEATDPPTDIRFKETSKFAHDAGVMIGLYQHPDNYLAMRHVKIREPSSRHNMLGIDIPVVIHPEYSILSLLEFEQQPLNDDAIWSI
jgi:replicative DNA helicase